MSDTRPGELSSREADKIADRLGRVYSGVNNGNGRLNTIILGVATFGMSALIMIGGYGLLSLIDLKTEFAKMQTKVDILYCEVKKDRCHE